MFARFVVVRNQRVDFFRISERHLSAEVGVTGNEVCQRITAVVARKHSIDNSLSQRLDVSNQARTTFVQHQNDGLPGLGKSLHQIELVLGEEEVRQVTRSLAVRVLTDAGNDVVGTGSGSYSFLYLRSVFFPPVATLLISDTGFVNDIVRTEFIGEGFKNRIVLACMLIGLVTLPRVGPAAVEATHGVGIRTGNQQLLAFCQRQYTVCILQEYQRFLGSLEGGGGMFCTTEQGEVFQIIIGLFK